jgi:hypothetical protein
MWRVDDVYNACHVFDLNFLELTQPKKILSQKMGFAEPPAPDKTAFIHCIVMVKATVVVSKIKILYKDYFQNMLRVNQITWLNDNHHIELHSGFGISRSTRVRTEENTLLGFKI